MKSLSRLLLVLISLLLFSDLAYSEQQNPENYFSRLKKQGVIKIKTGFVLLDLTEVDVERETIGYEGILTLKWKDEALKFDSFKEDVSEKVYQGTYMIHEVFNGWWPIVFLANESGQFEIDGEMIRVYPNGEVVYTMSINVVAKVNMNLHSIPFDKQECSSFFEIMGVRESEVQFVKDESTTNSRLPDGYVLEDWKLMTLSVHTGEEKGVNHLLEIEKVSSLIVTMKMQREPGFLLQIVIIPLVLLVILSWSVFWMDMESVGDRMDLSFIGILSVVAYQIMVSENMPQISYFTLLSTFIYINYFVLCACVVENLMVSCLDKIGNSELGNKLDKISRWLFPLSYVFVNLIAFFLFV